MGLAVRENKGVRRVRVSQPADTDVALQASCLSVDKVTDTARKALKN